MKALRIVVVLAVVAAAGGYAYYYYYLRGQADGQRLRLSGNIEAIEAQMSFKIPGLVVERPVDEGYRVYKGALIAALETSDLRCDVALRSAELNAAKAALDELLAGSRPEEIASAKATFERAQASLDELLAGSRPQEIASAEATLASTAADKTRAEADYKRAAELRQRQAISMEEFDQFQTVFHTATARMHDAQAKLSLAKEGPRKEQIQQARAALAQAKAQYELVKAGPRKEDILQGRARVEQTTASLALAKVRLGYARLEAPMDAFVLSKNIEPGEYVATGTPVVTIADLINVWLRVYVSETDIDAVKIGQPAIITTDGKSGRSHEGRVSFISSQAEFTPKTVQTQQERVKLVYRVKIDITNKNLELKPGMPADAEIQIGQPVQPPVAK